MSTKKIGIICILATILFACLGCPFMCNGQFNCNNWSNYDRVLNIKGGVPFNASFEGGAQWSELGVFAGIKSWTKVRPDKNGVVEQDMPISVYAKATLMILNRDDWQFLFEGYGGPKLYGAGFQIGYTFANGTCIIINPEWSYEQGKEINAGISLKF